MSSILVIAAHPDDEVLGAGGAIARWSNEGQSVHILIMAEGVTSRSIAGAKSPLSELSELVECAKRSAKILGAASIDFVNLPDNRMDSLALLDVIKPIEAKIDTLLPHTVVTHQPNCLNIDHQITNRAAVTACRGLPGASVKTMLFFESPSSSEWQVPGAGLSFQPNWYVNIESTIEIKMAALKEYDCEMRSFPHARSYETVRHLAHLRGSHAGLKAAEAFSLGRNIS